jgi:hypothetical protein
MRQAAEALRAIEIRTPEQEAALEQLNEAAAEIERETARVTRVSYSSTCALPSGTVISITASCLRSELPTLNELVTGLAAEAAKPLTTPVGNPESVG